MAPFAGLYEGMACLAEGDVRPLRSAVDALFAGGLRDPEAFFVTGLSLAGGGDLDRALRTHSRGDRPRGTCRSRRSTLIRGSINFGAERFSWRFWRRRAGSVRIRARRSSRRKGASMSGVGPSSERRRAFEVLPPAAAVLDCDGQCSGDVEPRRHSSRSRPLSSRHVRERRRARRSSNSDSGHHGLSRAHAGLGGCRTRASIRLAAATRRRGCGGKLHVWGCDLHAGVNACRPVRVGDTRRRVVRTGDESSSSGQPGASPLSPHGEASAGFCSTTAACEFQAYIRLRRANQLRPSKARQCECSSPPARSWTVVGGSRSRPAPLGGRPVAAFR